MTLESISTSSFQSEKGEDVQQELGPAPDGKFDAYFQTLLGHLVCFNTWGFILSFGAFQTYYGATLPEGPSDISWIGSTQVFLINFVGAFSGRALDAGYFRSVFAVGLFLQLLGVFTASIATTYWQILLSQGVCVGIGTGLQFCPVMGLVATYFSRRRVFAIALAMTGASTGGLVYPAVARSLLIKPGIGFGWTMRILGFMMLATGLLCLAFFKPRLPGTKRRQFFEFSALKEKTYSLFVFGMFFNFWALNFAIYYVGQFSETILGFSFEQSVDLLVILNGVGVLGRLIPAYLADAYVGPLNFLIPSTFLCGLIYFCWATVHTSVGVYIFAVLYGFTVNSVQGLWPSALSSLTDDVTKTGARMGLGFTITSFAILTGPPLGGALLQDQGNDYLPSQVWGGCCLLLGGILFLCARLYKTGPRFWYPC